MSKIIKIQNLIKNYGNHKVIKDVSFEVEKGEIFALLGTNGAGKTTILECTENLRKYDSGTITVNGKMGIQLQSSSLPAHIKAIEAVILFAKMNKVEIDYKMINSLGINEFSGKQYRELSTGQKRRLHLALALINNPDIIFLDEPTAGLDVEGRMSLHKQIKKLKEKGKTIILSSHDMAEVKDLCDRLAILNNGQIAFLGTPEELTKKLGKQYTIYIQTENGDNYYQTDNIGETMLSLLKNFQKENIKVLDIKIDHGSLEQNFIEIARGNK